MRLNGRRHHRKDRSQDRQNTSYTARSFVMHRSLNTRYMAYLQHITTLVHVGNMMNREHTHFLVHSRAVASYRARSVLYKCAMSGTRGSSGFGSVSIEQIERSTVFQPRMSVSIQQRIGGDDRTRRIAQHGNRFAIRSHRRQCRHTQAERARHIRGSCDAPFEIVNAGLHWSLKISRQIEPFALMFGW